MQHRENPRIAILMDVVFSGFQEELRVGISHYLEESGMTGVYFGLGSLGSDTLEDFGKEIFFRFIDGESFDGILIVSSSLIHSGGEILRVELEKIGDIPMVSIGPSAVGEDNFIIDNISGIQLIMDHLIQDHHYSKFAYVSGPLLNLEAKSRLNAFMASLDSAGISYSDTDIFHGDFLPPSGCEAVKTFFDERNLKPEVIVCANDFMAIGVFGELRRRGFSIPRDIAVTGFDDTRMSKFLSHNITSINQQFYKLGYLAIKQLHNQIQGGKKSGEFLVPAQIVKRSSCGCEESKAPVGFDLPQGKSFDDFIELLKLYISGGFLESELSQIYTAWKGIVSQAIKDISSPDEIRNILHSIIDYLFPQKNSTQMKVLCHKLDLLIFEFVEQQVFINYWDDTFLSFGRSYALRELSAGLKSDLILTTHDDLFLNLMDQYQAKSFSVFGFNNPGNIEDGTYVIFSHNGNSSKENLSPYSNKWLPESSGSLVAGMIHKSRELFGYFLMDAEIKGSFVFSNLGEKLSDLFNDIKILQNVRDLNGELKEAIQLVEQLATVDELTGLHNRRGFLTLAEQQIKYLRREKLSFVILFADMDGLKKINDTWGHKEGDLAIKMLAKSLKLSLRESDIIARLGGDEFVALLTLSDNQTFEVIRERINLTCEKINKEWDPSWVLTVSIGHYRASIDSEIGIDEMLEKADAELYEQKRMKKNRRK